MVNVLPDPKDLVHRVERAHFPFVVRVLTRDEDFDIVLLPDLRIALRHGAPHVRLLHPETEVELLVVPQHRDARIEPGGLTGHNIDERRALRRAPPAQFVEFAIDGDRSGGAVAGVADGLYHHYNSTYGSASLLAQGISHPLPHYVHYQPLAAR